MASGRRRALAVVAVVASMALAGCGGDDDSADHADHGEPTSTSSPGATAGPGATSAPSTTADGHAHETTSTAFPRSQASERVEIELVDFSFVGMPATVTGPKAFFSGVNKGPSDHEMEIIDQDGRSVGAVKPYPKGQTRELAVELQPGTYTIQCLVKQGDQTHAQLGMKNTFAVS